MSVCCSLLLRQPPRPSPDKLLIHPLDLKPAIGITTAITILFIITVHYLLYPGLQLTISTRGRTLPDSHQKHPDRQLLVNM